MSATTPTAGSADAVARTRALLTTADAGRRRTDRS